MRLMGRHLTYTLFIFWSSPLLMAQALPSGKHHDHRERTIDIQHYRAEINFDFEARSLSGKTLIRARTLNALDAVSLDGINMQINKAQVNGSDCIFTSEPDAVNITLPQKFRPNMDLSIYLEYSCVPKSGVAFHPGTGDGDFYVYSFGEGGLHANWMPGYTGLNEKFSSELVLNVPKLYKAISNGVLVSCETSGDTVSYHWLHEKTHATYLVAFYVGKLEEVKLDSPDGIPMSCWVPKNKVKEAAFTFRNTAEMISLYSKLFDYPYPWVKYDQVAMPDYAPLAMEHTTVTGVDWAMLHDEKATREYNLAVPGLNWSSEDIIAHEAVHHWFGNNLTARDESYIWLNESLTTYLSFVWSEKKYGVDELKYAIHRAREMYQAYSIESGIIRPLEYHYWDNKDAIFDFPITYLKGATVVHMLRHILGDEAFFRSLHYYLKKHEFGNVVSHDLKIAIEEATGRNLGWFFDQWVFGGGMPKFQVSYRYWPQYKIIDLSVTQTQPRVAGQGIFTLPVDITIATPTKTWTHRIQVTSEREQYTFPSDEPPLMVSFDGQGALVADIHFAKGFDELVYQIRNDGLSGQIRAIAQLTESFPTQPETVNVLKETALSKNHWSVKRAAVLGLAAARTKSAEQVAVDLLKHEDYHVRMSVAEILPRFSTERLKGVLKRLVEEDSSEEVVAKALISLGLCGFEDTAFMVKHAERSSWYDMIKTAAMTAMGEIGRPELLASVKQHANLPYNAFVRMAALQAWQNIDPHDQELHKILIDGINSPIYFIQNFSIAKAGELCLVESLNALQAIADSRADAVQMGSANTAIAEINRIRSATKR